MEESTAGATAPRPHEEHLPYAVAVVEEFAAAGVAMVEFWADNDEPRDAATELVETLATDTQLFVGWTEGDDGWHAVPYAGDDRLGYTVYSLAVAPLAPAWARYLAGVGEAARLCLPGPARSARPG